MSPLARRTSETLLGFWVLGGLAGMPSVSRAQGPRDFSFSAAAVFVGLSGDAYKGLGGGPGLEAQARLNLPASLSIGGGVQYSRHSFASEFLLRNPLSLVSLFAEPRLVIGVGRARSAAYLAGRAAILMQRTTADNLDISASGVQLGGGGGLLLALTPRGLNLDVGGMVGVVTYGSYSGAGVQAFDAGSGVSVAMRVGLWF